MSWMDSWSRPGKHAAVPPPLYLTQGDAAVYCHTCGRIMNSPRKAQKRQNQATKYCSDRCRRNKPGEADARIDRAIVALLDGEPESGIETTQSASKKVKGDPRNTVTCGEIEVVVFGDNHDPMKTAGRRKNRFPRGLAEEPEPEFESSDYISHPPDLDEVDHSPEHIRPLVRPPQIESDVNGSVGGEKGRAERTDETPEQLTKRQEGQRRAEQLEMVRRAARRGVVFGFKVDETTAPEQNTLKRSKQEQAADASPETIRRKCEAVMKGSVVEPSFAKGDWAIRWRE